MQLLNALTCSDAVIMQFVNASASPGQPAAGTGNSATYAGVPVLLLST